MTLFIQTGPYRRFEVSEAYVMALSFLIAFAVVKIVQAVSKKQPKMKSISNPRGGSLGVEVSDDKELAMTILTCMADNERYLVKDPEIRKVIFNLVKAKVKNESLVLTPNMMRFLALKLVKNDQTLVVRLGNIVLSSSSRARLIARIAGGAVLGVIGAIFSVVPYAVLIALLYFDVTMDCGYKCSDYFETLPKEGPVRIYDEEPTGHLAITATDDPRQIEIYTPLKTSDSITVKSNGNVERKYTKTRKKAKQVKFSDFRKTDPVLSAFQDLEEPKVSQKTCPIDDIHDLLDIRVD